jgi:triosephosphate isomerase
LDYLTPITNTAWVHARLCKLQKGCTRLAATTFYHFFAHRRWFSPSTPGSFTTKTGCHDIAEILLKVALIKHNKSKSIITEESSNINKDENKSLISNQFSLKNDL